MDKHWVERTKQRMSELGYKQRDLALALGCSRGAIGHYLSGRREPNQVQLQNIAGALSVSPLWLQFGVESATSCVEEASPSYELSGALTFPFKQNPTDHSFAQREQSLVFPPDCYALRFPSSQNGPRFHEGDTLLLSPSSLVEPGHEVWIEGMDGNAAPYVFISSQDGFVTLEVLSAERSREVRPESECKIIHQIVAILPARHQAFSK